MSENNQLKKLLPALVLFGLFYWLPVGTARFDNAIIEAFHLVKWYTREHVLLCLVPAFFIAGAISVFISQGAVMNYLGPAAKKGLAYLVASVSGAVLAVCSCTILPLFAGIYRMGAGLGPATTFLYAGPAINVLAVILTARILGPQLGIARAVGAVLFSIAIGLAMQFLFKKEDQKRLQSASMPTAASRPLWQNMLFFGVLAGILVFANWGKPQNPGGVWGAIFAAKWYVTSAFALGLGVMLNLWFKQKWYWLALIGLVVAVLAIALPQYPVAAFAAGALGLAIITATGNSQSQEWYQSSRDYALQILPLLLAGVAVAGLLLGRVGHQGLIPNHWVADAVGGNSLRANFFASFAGAFMYFATLTEVPILQGLLGSGMGQGPALALLLAGPALSLPNMLVIKSVLGTRKTIVFVSLVIVMATFGGYIYGLII